jgi:hypothetical protein
MPLARLKIGSMGTFESQAHIRLNLEVQKYHSKVEDWKSPGNRQRHTIHHVLRRAASRLPSTKKGVNI